MGAHPSLGVEWGPVRNGIADVAGIPRPVLREFSTRRREIEAHLDEHGQHSARAAQVATYATRRAKDRRPDADGLAPGLAGTGRSRSASTLRRSAAVLDRCRAIDPPVAGQRRGRPAVPVAGQPGGVDRHGQHVRSARRHQGGLQRPPAGGRVDQVLDLVDGFLRSEHVLAVRVDDRAAVIHRHDGTVIAARTDEYRWTTPEMLETETRLLATALDRRGSRRRRRRRHGDRDRRRRAAVARPTSRSDGADDLLVGRRRRDRRRRRRRRQDLRPRRRPRGLGGSGYRVIGCSLAARAAKQLQDDAGIPASTIDRLLAGIEPAHRRHSTPRPCSWSTKPRWSAPASSPGSSPTPRPPVRRSCSSAIRASSPRSTPAAPSRPARPARRQPSDRQPPPDRRMGARDARRTPRRRPRPSHRRLPRPRPRPPRHHRRRRPRTARRRMDERPSRRRGRPHGRRPPRRRRRPQPPRPPHAPRRGPPRRRPGRARRTTVRRRRRRSSRLRNDYRLGLLNGTRATIEQIDTTRHEMILATTAGTRARRPVRLRRGRPPDPRLRHHHPQGPGRHRRPLLRPRRRHHRPGSTPTPPCPAAGTATNSSSSPTDRRTEERHAAEVELDPLDALRHAIGRSASQAHGRRRRRTGDRRALERLRRRTRQASDGRLGDGPPTRRASTATSPKRSPRKAVPGSDAQWRLDTARKSLHDLGPIGRRTHRAERRRTRRPHRQLHR